MEDDERARWWFLLGMGIEEKHIFLVTRNIDFADDAEFYYRITLLPNNLRCLPIFLSYTYGLYTPNVERVGNTLCN